jgi:hypothetical protein
MAVARPLMIGYLRVTAGSDSTTIDLLRQRMAVFAERKGFVLGEVVIGDEAAASTSGFAALVDAVLAAQVEAVLVPTLEHFGRLPGVRVALRDLLQHRTGARVIVMDSGNEELV